MREAIFSALDSWEILPGAHVIDLYAGSGALGLEAVSRGAMSAVLVEKNPAAAGIAKENAKAVGSAYKRTQTTDPTPRIEVVTRAVSAYLETASVPADVIFIDPPYELDEDALSRDLERITGILTIDGVVMVERSSRSPEPTWPSGSDSTAGLSMFRRKDYGETVLWWAERSDRPE